VIDRIKEKELASEAIFDTKSSYKGKREKIKSKVSEGINLGLPGHV
jgi:hypothetical protein